MTYQNEAQIHKTQIQRQKQQINKQTLLSHSVFLAYSLLQQKTLFMSAPLQTPQPELLNYSKTPHFFIQPINFANTDKIYIFELPQPIHTVSTKEAGPQDISLTL